MVEQIEHKTGMIRRNIQSTYVNVNECNNYHYRDEVDLGDSGSSGSRPRRNTAEDADEEESKEDDVFFAKENGAHQKKLAV